ncbi:hypothetical protein BJ138DRAFT_1181796 [Hygrophoropsis aurantiaca]|uniref:Uncharacterized protein n=1 Tax=Hygrophoropsis aurantiaca TaxID=72124 RepID=A0ACB8A5R2_9AGAM|nr:hypothetical protein BJ138DRAFT_1181796 [Hygrophoropsis aurantiaca]
MHIARNSGMSYTLMRDHALCIEMLKYSVLAVKVVPHSGSLHIIDRRIIEKQEGRESQLKNVLMGRLKFRETDRYSRIDNAPFGCTDGAKEPSGGGSDLHAPDKCGWSPNRQSHTAAQILVVDGVVIVLGKLVPVSLTAALMFKTHSLK